MLAVVAGSDTVSSTLTSTFFCLLAHPDKYARLQEEIDRFFPPGESIPLTAERMRGMHYLQAVMLVAFPSLRSLIMR